MNEPSTAIQTVATPASSQLAAMMDGPRFANIVKLSELFADSKMIPSHFQNSVPDCFIALNMADRLDVDPFMLMQNLYVVHGKPGMEAKLVISLINSSGLFVDSLDYEIQGDDPDDAFDPSYRVRAFAVRRSTGKRINGPWITWTLAKAEGWTGKPGSKWNTMPEQMFSYRAASFFGRLHCPERLMGMMTSDELQDMGLSQSAIPVSKGEKAILDAIESEGTAPGAATVAKTRGRPRGTATVETVSVTPATAPIVESTGKDPLRDSGEWPTEPATTPTPGVIDVVPVVEPTPAVDAARRGPGRPKATVKPDESGVNPELAKKAHAFAVQATQSENQAIAWLVGLPAADAAEGRRIKAEMGLQTKNAGEMTESERFAIIEKIKLFQLTRAAATPPVVNPAV